MHKFITLNTISQRQAIQYREAIGRAFPPIIGESAVIKKYWSRLEENLSEYQIMLLADDGELIGFMNTVPFYFNEGLDQLPDRGWDWMLTKGMKDYQSEIAPNYLGGLQVIVRKKFQGQGYSKVILRYAKKFVDESIFENLVIPIRPIYKHRFPTMPMTKYMNLKDENIIYDPWIRTHINGGAEVIKVCEQSMIMKGDIKFWESMLNKRISKSGQYPLSGALSLIDIDVENDSGQYVEANIWIKY
jgi:GNAT superfamily N-acetyltransferase